ncbi:MAG TPA: hypothetical protein VLB68_23450 [Pyrinomonadaceae bacterium]|nr:hypothetical protein [Pyrinomonadaceae bacterium]
MRIDHEPLLLNYGFGPRFGIGRRRNLAAKDHRLVWKHFKLYPIENAVNTELGCNPYLFPNCLPTASSLRSASTSDPVLQVPEERLAP